MKQNREAPSADRQLPSAKFIERFREHRLKVTPQRLAVYDALQGAVDHPSAEQIFHKVRKRLQHISFDTVNRTLLTFAEIHLVDTVEGSGEPRRFDPRIKEHHHFLCTRCRGITDIEAPARVDVPVPPEIRRTCEVTGRRIIYQGICESCRQTARSRLHRQQP
jgi:Fur family peroxide stress response transcriptional regulator